MKYIYLAGTVIIWSIGIALLSMVLKEAMAFGFINHSPDGTPTGILNAEYPQWFYVGIGVSVGLMFVSAAVTKRQFKK